MKYLVRLIVYIAKKAVALLIIGGILIVAFTGATSLSNVFVLVTDGMELRANVILGNKDGDDLYKYFSAEFLEQDEMLNDSPYQYYDIVGSSYNIKLKKMWVWPWQSSVHVTVEERVTLEGYLLVEYQTAEQLADPNKIPAENWDNGRYDLILNRQPNGSWIILSMKKMEALPDTTPRPSN